MAEPFVPLFATVPPAGGATGAARLSALASGTEKSSFVPSLVGAVATPAAGTPHCVAPHGETAQPTVTLHHDDGKVTRIRIHCACGQVIDLDCVY